MAFSGCMTELTVSRSGGNYNEYLFEISVCGCFQRWLD